MRFLIGLQECDTKIRTIEVRKGAAPEKIGKIEKDLSVLEKQLEEELNRLEGNKKDRRQVEREIDDLEGRIEKSNAKLTSIKSNKEYQAALKEIDDLKREKATLEDQVIGIMEQIEALEVNCESRENDMTKAKKSAEKEKEEIHRELQALDLDLESLQAARNRFCKAIDRDLLSQYDFLRERKGGYAVSSVLQGVCQTCHMNIPPQKFNELIRGDALMTCPNCHRIMYWGDNEQFQQVLEGS
jgi:predicted  nucleic acid-binding Zn-ribbon protein